MANSNQNIRLITPENTGTIINIITELEEMKDIHIVKEKHKIGAYNMERAVEIVRNTEFLREIARSLDEEGKNKKKIEESRSKTSEQILKEIEDSNKTNSRLNGVIVGVTTLLICFGLMFLSSCGVSKSTTLNSCELVENNQECRLDHTCCDVYKNRGF